MIYDHVSGSLSKLDSAMVRAVPEGGNWRDLPESIDSARVRQIRKGAARGGGSRSTYYGRLRWDRPSYTVSTYFNRPGNGCFIHPSADRLITIREAARLQSFPDAYRFCGKGRARYLQVGNAVPPLLAYHLGRMLRPGTFVDLFSGAGGMSLGLEWAGFEPLVAVDHDVAANETFQRNRSGGVVALSADLSDSSDLKATTDEIRRRVGCRRPLALVAGGPPCQGFSTAGQCRLDDPRNGLVSAFLTVIEVLRPLQVLMENVASLTFRRHMRALTDLQGSLCKIGYGTSVIVAHAEGYGVPQLRRRLFVMASRTTEPRWPKPCRQILPPLMSKYQPHGLDADLDGPVTVQEAIGDLPTRTADSPDEPVDYARAATSEYQRWIRGEIGLDELSAAPEPAERPPSLFDTGPGP